MELFLISSNYRSHYCSGGSDGICFLSEQKMLLIIIRSEYHQSYALFLMWYLSLSCFFYFCYVIYQ